MVTTNNSDPKSVLIAGIVSTLWKSMTIVYKANCMPIITKIISITSEIDRDIIELAYMPSRIMPKDMRICMRIL